MGIFTIEPFYNLCMCDAYSEISGISAYTTSEVTAGSTTKQHSSCRLKFVNLELLMHNTVNVGERRPWGNFNIGPM